MTTDTSGIRSAYRCPSVHDEKGGIPINTLRRKRIVASGSGVLLALIAWNLGNFLFFVIAGRILGPEEYGLVAALLAATMVVMVPATAFQYAIARDESGLVAANDPQVGAVYRKALGRTLLGVALAGAVSLALVAVIPFDDIPRREIAVTLLVVVPMVPLFLALGQLQAEQRFVPFAFATAAIGVPRPIALGFFTLMGLGVYAPLVASTVALVIAAYIAMRAAARPASVNPPRPSAWRAFRRALPPLIVGLCGLSLLTNLDIVVAKLALSAQQAGEFGAIAVLAKAIVVIPQAVSIVVLPRVAARRAEGRDTGPLLAGAIGLTFSVGALATLAAWIVAEPVVRLTYGADYLEAAHLLAPLTGAAALLGGLIVLLNHHIGRSADRFVWSLAAVAAFEVLLFGVFHGSAGQLVAVDAIACAVGILVHEALMGRGPDGMIAGLVRLTLRRNVAS